MRKLAYALIPAAVGSLAAAHPASAQNLWVGGGVAFPMSDYGDYAKTGYEIVAGAGFPISDGGLNVTVEGFYGQNNHKDAPDGNTTTPYGIMGGFEYDLDAPGESSVTPYVFAQAGILWQKYESDTFGNSTDSTFGYGGGAGVSFPIGGVDGWVEGRLTNGSIDDGGTSYNTMFGSILGGISINVGG